MQQKLDETGSTEEDQVARKKPTESMSLRLLQRRSDRGRETGSMATRTQQRYFVDTNTHDGEEAMMACFHSDYKNVDTITEKITGGMMKTTEPEPKRARRKQPRPQLRRQRKSTKGRNME